MLDRTSKELSVPAALAVAELEATPAFESYSEPLHGFVSWGKSGTGLAEATPPFVAMPRTTTCAPDTILEALHRAGCNVGTAGRVADQLSDQRYTTLHDQLWYQYFQWPHESSAPGEGDLAACGELKQSKRASQLHEQ